MWYKIKQGRHRAYPLSLEIHTGKTREDYIVKFDESCLYEVLDWEDDTNKLAGWSYGIHTKNSIRVGWRPSRINKGRIELSLYIYDSGIRTMHTVGEVDVNKEYRIVLEVFHKLANLYVVGIIPEERSLFEQVEVSMIPKWGYNLGCYFGGNMESPKDMKIWIKKL